MLYFMINKDTELQICPVSPEMEKIFRRLYGSRILVRGDSLADCLRKFHELPVTIAYECV